MGAEGGAPALLLGLDELADQTAHCQLLLRKRPQLRLRKRVVERDHGDAAHDTHLRQITLLGRFLHVTDEGRVIGGGGGNAQQPQCRRQILRIRFAVEIERAAGRLRDGASSRG